MTDRLPGKYRTELHTKPWFFSGRVPDIKYSYTVSGLTPSPYPIRPRSIVPGAKINIQPIKPSYINVDESKSQDFKREYREYNFLKDNDVLLTIEHCDNCEEHSSSTRHDPAKYAFYAQSIKNAVLARYPMVKILMKPVSKLDPESNKKRMGAFEVQVSNKTKGKLNVNVLHSKLASRRWPDISDIIAKLSSYLPTCQLSVTVFDENSQDKTLKGLKVLVRPRPVEIKLQRPTSFIRKDEPCSHYSTFRPKSAATTRSVKSMRIMSSRRFSHKSFTKPKNSVVYEKVTDRDGTCLYDNVPLDVYEIEVVETKDYKGSIKVFNTFEEKLQNSSLNIYIGVKSRENSNITVFLRDPLLKEEVSNSKVSILKEAEIYYLIEVKRGVYEISVPKGDYSLSIISGRYKDVIKKISANEAEIVISENLELKKTKEMTVLTYDATTGESISGVIVELTINNNAKYEGFTKSGKHSFKLEESGFYYIKSRIRGYCKSKISMVIGNNDICNIVIPLVPLNTDYPVIVASWGRFCDDIEIYGQSKSLSLSLQNPRIDGFNLIDLMKSHGFATIIILDDTQDLRVTIKGLTNELSSFNGMTYSGLNIQFYCWRRFVTCIKPSSGSGEWWDVGIYSGERKDFIETNFISNYKIPIYDFFQDVTNIIRHTQAADSVADAFQFINGVTKNMSYGKDVFLSPEIFKKNIQNFVSNEFLSILCMALNSPDGVSLNFLNNRYGRYAGAGKCPYKKIEEFISELGLGKEDEDDFRGLIEEIWLARFPESWEVMKNSSGDIVYKSLDGEVSKEHPNIVICRKKILNIRKEEMKVKQKAIEPVKKQEVVRAVPEPHAQSLRSSKSPKSPKSPKSSKSSKSSKKSNDSYKKKNKEKSYSSSSSDHEEDNEKFLQNVNSQCEKLAELALQNIELYENHGKIDKDIHSQLIEKITNYLTSFDEQLQVASDSKTKEIFNFWKSKFLEIKANLESMDIHSKKTKESKKHSDKKSSSSSSDKKSSSSSLDKSKDSSFNKKDND
ncbi:hypothetical protein SteCoe_1811 [Stentor coeruleus]|uniref:Uncharacterized protein n=1 Tax=Stentor coeruleus TaxID=5963 RepID=A0A1R2D152_9CILI|nr:hypothetical protein SteCoe_1811 [Stentor coeruleus]